MAAASTSKVIPKAARVARRAPRGQPAPRALLILTEADMEMPNSSM